MQYKILLVRNRIKTKFSFKEGLDWFKKNTPFEIITEEITTDFDVTTEQIGNATYKGVICGDDIYPKLRTVVPEGKYHAVVFIPGNKLSGIRVNVSEGQPLYPGTDLIQLFTLTGTGKTLNHEIIHTFFHRLKRQQIFLEDPMDMVFLDGVARPYYNNSLLNANPSNRSIALERLAPYWALVGRIIAPNESKPRVVITRGFDDKVQAQGILNAGGFSCKTLERPWKNNLPNISCIPKGVYNCKWSFSPKFLKYTYEIQNVVGRSGIRIHSGNFFFDISGCVLLGDRYGDINADGRVDILNSRKTVKAFEKSMSYKDFTLEIK
ncbi:DUF5675 family protein [Candidatus Dojkabacteria bacterium]|jgi:hypothetical protein|nr:DUF5675 family protein [Candidatus Dojkabacteria bacterium]